MSKKRSSNSRAASWNRLNDLFGADIPHVVGWWNDNDDFSEIRIKARDDGTLLAIAKGYDSSGAPIVCFASGYDVSSCLLALDASIQGGNWRVDKPWQERPK